MPPSKAQQAATAKRRAQAIQMLLAGVDYGTITEKLGYASRQAASKDVCRALDTYREEMREQAANHQARQLMRLDRVLASVWPKVLKGDLKAADTALRVITQQCKVLGVDAPIRAEITGPGGGPISLTPADMDEFERLLSAGDADPTADPDGDETVGDDTP